MMSVVRHPSGNAVLLPWWVNPELPEDNPFRGENRRVRPRRRRRPWYVAVAALLAVSLAVLLSRQSGSNGEPRLVPASPHRSAPAPERLPARLVKYQNAVDVAAADGLSVWLEADLVKRWRAGPASFSSAIDQVAMLSRRNVVGIKIADELGYHDGLVSQAQIKAFLQDTARALHRKAPGRLILVDLVVPELACLPGWTIAPVSPILCQARARAAHPALQISAVTGYLKLHAIDVLDLSADLYPQHTYNYWGSSLDQAQTLAWRTAISTGWPSLVRLQGRHAFAHRDRYLQPASVAAQDVHTYIGIPTRGGAAAVDVWTWDAQYRGHTVRLTDPNIAGNPLWTQLKRAHDAGAVLYTHFSPTYVQRDVPTDLRAVASVFRGVFIAAGTG